MSEPIWATAPPAPDGPAGRYGRAVLWPDTHLGDQDDRAILLALRVTAAVRPSLFIQLGDVLDFYGLSRFDNNPDIAIGSVKRELDLQHALYERLDGVLPRKTERIQIIGNHEERLVRFIWKNPALVGALDLGALMDLKRFGFTGGLRPTYHVNPSFLVTHGSHIRKDAGQSAKSELMATMVSGASGHTHRLGTFSFTTEGAELSWTECGHLQNRTPEWLRMRPNWNQGLVILDYELGGGNAFAVTPVHFRRSYRCVVNGMEIRA